MRYGHDVTRLEDAGMSGSSDDVVFEFAQNQHAVLVTGDLGVADARLLSSKSHFGVILLRMPNEMSSDQVNSEIERLLPDLALDHLSNTIVVIEPGNMRVRSTS